METQIDTAGTGEESTPKTAATAKLKLVPDVAFTFTFVFTVIDVGNYSMSNINNNNLSGNGLKERK